MSRAATILLVLAAVGILVFTATTHRWRFSSERLIQPGSPLFQLDPADVTGIHIKNSDQSFRLQREPGAWTLFSQIHDAAAPEAVEALLATAANTVVLDRIDSEEIRDEKNLSSYGVLKSTLQLDFKGDRPPALLFGKSSPDGTRTYVSFENSKTVYLIPSDLARLLSLPIDRFREHRIAPLPPGHVAQLVIQKAGTTLKLERDGTGWLITKPLKVRANSAAVTALLDRLLALRLEAFESSSQTTPLDPAAKIQIYDEGSDVPLTITFGLPAADGSLTARLEPRGITCRVPAATAGLLDTSLDSLRDRSLALVNLDTVDLIRLQTHGTTRDLSRTPEGWTIPTAAVERLAAALAHTQVTTYKPAIPALLEQYGLTNPAYRLDFLAVLSENTPETQAGIHPVLQLAIGHPLPDSSLPVHIQGSPEIAIVPPTFLDCLPAP
jgi:hypothetical protein